MLRIKKHFSHRNQFPIPPPSLSLLLAIKRVLTSEHHEKLTDDVVDHLKRVIICENANWNSTIIELTASPSSEKFPTRTEFTASKV